MENTDSNTNVTSNRSREAALIPFAGLEARVPTLGDHWLAQLTPDEIEGLLERRSPLLHSMLSASTDVETRSVMFVVNAAASYLWDDLELPEFEVWNERRAVLQGFLEDVFADAAWRVHEGKMAEAF